MKKILSALLVSVLAFGLVGCGGNGGDAKTSEEGSADKDMTTVTVAASPTPHAEILGAVKDQLADEGIFAGKDKGAKLENIADGATIAVPNDTTNEARALQLLAAQGVIELPKDADLTVTPKDIVKNPHNIDFKEVEAAAVPSMLADVDFAVINGNYALGAGLTADDSLAFEASDSLAAQTYSNILVVKEGNEKNEAIQKLVEALTSETCRKFIEEKYSCMVVPSF